MEEINNQTETKETKLSIKVKTIDSNEFKVDVSKDSNISELKRIIEEVSKVPINKQRLIFRGRLLKDADRIDVYKISNMDVIHLVAKPGNLTEENPAQVNAQSQDQDQQRPEDGSRRSLLRGVDEILFGRDRLLPSIFNLPRRSRRQDRTGRQDPSFNTTECREVIRQTLATLNNFEQTKTTIPSSNGELPEMIFNFETRKLVKGQWVDVKDTIDQWLEAQVIDVNVNQVYVHYYGWGNRWDEWIDMSSNRIKPFRTHTTQSSLKNYVSCVPNTTNDTSINLEEPGDCVFLDYFPQLFSNFNLVVNQFNELDKLRKSQARGGLGLASTGNQVATGSLVGNAGENITSNLNTNTGNTSNNLNPFSSNALEVVKAKKEMYKKAYLMINQMVPYVDRVGRLMTDMSTFISQSVKHKKLEDLDKNFFNVSERELFYSDPNNSNFQLNLQTPLGISSGSRGSSFFSEPLIDIHIHSFFPRPGETGSLGMNSSTAATGNYNSNAETNNTVTLNNNQVVPPQIAENNRSRSIFDQAFDQIFANEMNGSSSTVVHGAGNTATHSINPTSQSSVESIAQNQSHGQLLESDILVSSSEEPRNPRANINSIFQTLRNIQRRNFEPLSESSFTTPSVNLVNSTSIQSNQVDNTIPNLRNPSESVTVGESNTTTAQRPQESINPTSTINNTNNPNGTQEQARSSSNFSLVNVNVNNENGRLEQGQVQGQEPDQGRKQAPNEIGSTHQDYSNLTHHYNQSHQARDRSRITNPNSINIPRDEQIRSINQQLQQLSSSTQQGVQFSQPNHSSNLPGNNLTTHHNHNITNSYFTFPPTRRANQGNSSSSNFRNLSQSQMNTISFNGSGQALPNRLQNFYPLNIQNNINFGIESENGQSNFNAHHGSTNMSVNSGSNNLNLDLNSNTMAGGYPNFSNFTNLLQSLSNINNLGAINQGSSDGGSVRNTDYMLIFQENLYEDEYSRSRSDSESGGDLENGDVGDQDQDQDHREHIQQEENHESECNNRQLSNNSGQPLQPNPQLQETTTKNTGNASSVAEKLTNDEAIQEQKKSDKKSEKEEK